MDRRRFQRWDFEAPVTFSWKDAGGIRHRAKGTVKNISAGGALVSTYRPPPPDASVRFRVFFSSFHPDSSIAMEIIGRVVRAESGVQAEVPGEFAVAFRSYTLHDEKYTIDLGRS